MERFFTGEWIKVSTFGLTSTHIVVCQNQDCLVLSDGMVYPIGIVSRTSMRRMLRFVLSEDTVNYLRSRWAVGFEIVEPGMRLLVLVPPFGPDPKNYAAVKLITLAAKDCDRKILYDQDGDFIDINQAFYFGEKVVSDKGFLTETGQHVLNQLYS